MSFQYPDNGDDTIDSRDVIDRIAMIEADLADELDELDPEFVPDEDLTEELRILKALADEGEAAYDWPHGETLIRDSYFEDYARELAADIGAIKEGAGWPNNCIDWEEAAYLLKEDYTTVSFGDVTYWIRA